MNPNTHSGHAISIAQLCDYFLGYATPEDSRFVEIHLATCVACREILSVIALMSGAPAEEVAPTEGDHPTLEELVSYYKKPDACEPRSRARIEAHLTACADCRSELAFLHDVEDDLKKAAEAASH